MKERSSIRSIIIRYLILIAVAIPNLWLFYTIFTPLTVYPVKWLLGIFYDTLLVSGNVIVLNQSVPIQIISACVAGAAYYLLLMLNLFTPGIKTKKRIYMILLAFGVFLLVNIIRIFVMGILLFSNFSAFNITHEILWYVLSTIFVVGIWFYEVKKFHIKEIPLYSDLKFLYEGSRRKTRRRK